MYRFVDTNEAGVFGSLSAESVCINGKWLEEEVDGLTILSTAGRESLSAEVASFSVGSRNGGKFKSRRYPQREIVVRYQIIAKTAEDFREAYNRIAGLLNVEEVQVIFADEPDKYFVGTPTDFGRVEEGRNAVTGEFTILCLDPFKYDLEENVVTASNGVFNIDYAGTLGTRPRLIAEMAPPVVGTVTTYPGDTAYINFFKDSVNISAGDASTPQVSTRILSDSFANSIPSGWTANKKNLPASLYPASVGAVGYTLHNGRYGMSPTGYGTGESWHGPNISHDAVGQYMTARANLEFFCRSEKQRRLTFALSDAGTTVPYPSKGEWNILAGIRINKWEVGKNTAALQFIVGNTIVKQPTIIVNGSSEVMIQKLENAIIFEAFGETYTHVITSSSPASTSDTVENIVFAFETFGSDTVDGNETYHLVHSVNAFYDASGQHIEDDAFYSGDVLEMDCSTGFIYRNGVFSPELGDPSNDWEAFTIEPGMNTIRTACSSWTDTEPTYRLAYRGRYI